MKVKDVFQLDNKMKSLKLLAGEKGLNGEINDIGVLEVPDGILWSRKNDLIITTGYFIYKKEIELVDVIKILKQKEAVGLGIKTDRFLKSIPQEAIDLANKLDFPFFEIPIYLGYNDFIWPIISNILGEEDYINYRLMKYNEDILAVSKKNYYLKNIVELLANHINKPFLVISEEYKILADFIKNESESCKDAINQVIKNTPNIADNNDYFLTKLNNKQCYVFPLNTTMANLGYLCILSKKTITELELKIINRTIPYLTLSMVNDALKPKKQYESIECFIKDTLLNNKLTQNKLIEQAEYFSINIKQNRVLWVLKIVNTTETLPKVIPDIAKYLKEKLNNAYVIENNSYIICVLNNFHLQKDNDIIYNLIYNDLNSLYPNCKHTLAISEQFNNIASIKDAYSEALFCIDYATKKGINAVYQFKNLIVDNLIYELINNKHLNKSYEDIVVKIKGYDNKNQSNYFSTLVEYINTDHNVLKTSQNLYIHRNTLYKRLKKIEDILNIKLDNPNTKILLNLCLRFENIKD